MAMTITQALTRDHRAAMTDLVRALNNPRMVAALYPKIADEIRRHSKAEEATLYSALDQIPGDQKTVASLEAGHKQIGALLDSLDRTDYGNPTFIPTLRTVQRLLGEHIRFEESTVFPYTQRTLPMARQIALGQRYNLRMGVSAPQGNVSILSRLTTPQRTPNPCGCAGTNPRARKKPRARRRWYQHMFGGVGTLWR